MRTVLDDVEAARQIFGTQRQEGYSPMAYTAR